MLNCNTAWPNSAQTDLNSAGMLSILYQKGVFSLPIHGVFLKHKL